MNEDGLIYFYREILPLICQTIPTVKLYIVGKDPSSTVQKLAIENVIVTGKVPDFGTANATRSNLSKPSTTGKAS